MFSKDQENSRLYIESKSKLCKHYKLQEQLEEQLEVLEQALKESDEDPATNTDAISVMINQIDTRLTTISLEAERAIKPRGPFKWCIDAIKCQRACVALRYEKQKVKRQGNIEEVIILKKADSE